MVGKPNDSMHEKKYELCRRLKAQYKYDGGVSSDVTDVAKYLVSRCTVEDNPLNMHNIQVILYLLQKESLDYMGMPLHDGIFYAWDSGPIVPEVQEIFDQKGKIRKICHDMGPVKTIELIDIVLKQILALPPMDLHNASTKKSGAWQTVYNQHKGEKKEIPLYMIKVKG